jgi:hypothetical protein
VDGGQKPRKYGGMKLILSKFVHLQKPGPLGMLFPQWLPTAVQGLGQRPKASMTPFLPPYLRAFPPPLTRVYLGRKNAIYQRVFTVLERP